MAKVGKDDFVKGFVPHHNHGSVDYIGLSAGHVHLCLDVTSPPIPTQGQVYDIRLHIFAIYETLDPRTLKKPFLK